MHCLETLEDRIAPATLLANGSTVTYQDVDGDSVTVKFSKPIFADQSDADNVFIFDTGGVDGSNATAQQLQEINLGMLADTALSNGVKISVTVKKGVTAGGFPGDGYVSIGTIQTSKYLGDVSIKGDLSEIDIDNEDAAPQALGKLSVNSLGLYGSSTQATADFFSRIYGDVKEVSVKKDFQYVYFIIDGDVSKIAVGGSLLGGDLNGGASVFVDNGSLGSLSIGKNVIGGESASANVTADNDIGSIKVGGSILGGAGSSANFETNNGSIGTVTIGGDLSGGTGSTSGNIGAGTGISSIKIGGSLIGGAGSDSGRIYTPGELQKISIGGDLVGSSATGTYSVTNGGTISSGKIGSLSIAGSLIAGQDVSTGDVIRCGSIISDTTIGSLVIKGGIIGSSTHSATISAGGEISPVAPVNLAIGKISVGGDVRYADILAGYNDLQNPVNGSAQIGSVSVGGEIQASNVVAGIERGADGFFGTGDDSVINTVDPDIVANIASLVVKGRIAGNTMGNTGIVSSSFGKVSLSGNSYTDILLSQPYGVPYVLTPMTPMVGDGAQTVALYAMV